MINRTRLGPDDKPAGFGAESEVIDSNSSCLIIRLNGADFVKYLIRQIVI